MRRLQRSTLAATLALAGAMAAGSATLSPTRVCEGDGFRLELTPMASEHVMAAEGFTLSATISLAPSRCAADLVAPFGVLDAQDTAEFVVRMEQGAPDADLAEPFGVIDAADLVRYNALHAAGCN
ncbi:MAG: GC-type dockerin domain-anchored protein [Phycisphaerales bacterium]